jgi:thioredoxin reductase
MPFPRSEATNAVVDLVIVGGGPAGVAAARDFAARGSRALLLDEQPREDLAALDGLPPDTEVLTRHSVWGVFPTEPVASEDGMTVGVFDHVRARTFLVHARALVLATGAIDVDLAFRGSDVPGVMFGLDAVRGSIDARRMVVLGSGESAREVARRARQAGMDVVALVGHNASETGVPVYPRHTIRAVLGLERVEQVVLARVDGEREDLVIEADAVCVAIGRQPAIELAYLAGCPIEYDAARGGYVPRSIAGVTVTGDLAGTFEAADPRWHRLAERFASDETVMCACEGVTRGQILTALPRAFGHPDEVKRLTRAGMGVCQGRRCRMSIASLMALQLGVPLGEIPVASFRPPVRLLPLAALATEAPPPAPSVARRR